MRLGGIFLFGLLALPLAAGEFVVLGTGQRVRADRHELRGDRILLYLGEGVTDLPLAAIAGFELDHVASGAGSRPAADSPSASPIASEPPSELTLAPAPPSSDPRTLVREAAVRAGLPPEFVESVAQVESAFRPDALSPKGAIGVMQLMPETARTLGADPYDLRQNIDAGTRLLRELLVKYDGDVVKALAAYNAGEGAVDRYQGMPPYNETHHYVNKVIGAYQAAGK